MSDLIEIKLAASIADESLSSIQQQLKELEKANKIKLEGDTKDLDKKLKDVEATAKKPMKMDIDVGKVESEMRKVESATKGLRETSTKTFRDASGEVTGFAVTMQDASKRIKEVETFAKTAEGGFQSLGRVITDNVTKPVADMGQAMKENLKLDNTIDTTNQKLEAMSRQFGTLIKPEDKANVEGMMKALDPSDKMFPDKVREMNIELKRMGDTAKGVLKDQNFMVKQHEEALKTNNRMNAEARKNMEKQHTEALKMNQRFDKELLAAQTPKTVSATQFGGDMQRTGRSIMAMAAPIVAVGGAAIKASIDFESSFAGVKSCPLVS